MSNIQTSDQTMSGTHEFEQPAKIVDHNSEESAEMGALQTANQSKLSSQAIDQFTKIIEQTSGETTVEHTLDQTMLAIGRCSDNTSETSKAAESTDCIDEYACLVENTDLKSKKYYLLKMQKKDDAIFEPENQVNIQGEIGKSLVKLSVKAKREKLKVFKGRKLAPNVLDNYMMILDRKSKEALLIPVADKFDLDEDYSTKKKFVRSAARAEREFKRINEGTTMPLRCRKKNETFYIGDISAEEESEEEEAMNDKDLTTFMPSPPKRKRPGSEMESLYDGCLSVICNKSLPRLEKNLDEMPKRIAEHVLEQLTPKTFSKLENKCPNESVKERIWGKHCAHFKACAKRPAESHRDFFMRIVKFIQKEYKRKLIRGFSKKKGIKENYRIIEEDNEEYQETNIFEEEAMERNDSAPESDCEGFESDSKEIDYPEGSQ